jgi:hypothetical protein
MGLPATTLGRFEIGLNFGVDRNSLAWGWSERVTGR